MDIRYNKPLSNCDRKMFRLLKEFVYNGLNDKRIYEKLEVDFRVYERKKQGHSVCGELIISKASIYQPVIHFYNSVLRLGFNTYILTARRRLKTVEQYRWMAIFYQFAHLINMYNLGLETYDEFISFEDILGKSEKDKVNAMAIRFLQEKGLIQTPERTFAPFYDHRYSTISHQVLLLSIPILLFPFVEGMARIRFYHCTGYFNHRFQIVIEPKYGYDCGPFREGLAYVSTPAIVPKTRYGYINKKGIEVIPLQYESASSFNEGLAAVQLNQKWGVINKRGDVIIDFRYGVLSDCVGGYFIFVNDRKLGIMDKKGRELAESDKIEEQLCLEILEKVWDFNNTMSLTQEEGEWVWRDTDGSEMFRWRK